MRFSNKVTADKLCVVDFPSQHEVHAHIGWKNKNLWGNVMVAEKCARNIWYGPKSAFEDFPEPQGGQYQQLVGKAAYAHLLRFMLGFVNPTGYDAGASKHFFKYLTVSNSTHRRQSERMSRLVENLTTDFNIIGARIKPWLQPTATAMVARDLAEQRRGDTVLVLGDIADGVATDLTREIAVATNGNGYLTPKMIDVLHPDEESGRIISGDLQKMFAKKSLDIRTFYSPFEDIGLAMQFADCVYVTLEMDKNPEADRHIIESWKKRRTDIGKLVHMKPKKATGKKSKSSAAWSKAFLHDYVSPEDISQEVQRRSDNFRRAASYVKAASGVCAGMRVRRAGPSGRSVDFEVSRLER